jgi:CubicO group peptidase (beta-lactamase class C family)
MLRLWLGILFVFATGCGPQHRSEVKPTVPTLSGVGNAPQIVQPGLGAEIDSFLLSAADLGYSGIVLVARDGHIILNKGYGWADRERGIPLTAQHEFGLASVSKNFTAAVILRLQDQGLLHVSDPVGQHLPDWAADKAGVTIHHLLTHTAGFPLDIGPDELMLSLDTLLARASRVRLIHQPGARFLYSNLGYSLLAAVVERVAREPFERYVERELFAPAGMTQTRILQPSDSAGLGHCGYRAFMPGCILNVPNFHGGRLSWILLGGAGQVSTTTDMYRWDRALTEGAVLSRPAQAQAMTPYIPAFGAAAGYGWFVRQRPSDKLVYHTGGNGIVSAKFERFLDHGLTIVQYSNNSRGVYDHVTNEVTKIAMGLPYEQLPRASRVVPDELLERFCGTFRTDSLGDIRIEMRNGQLYIPLSFEQRSAISFLSGQPDSASAVERIAATAIADTIIRALAAADYGPVLSNIPADVDAEDERLFWSTHWVRMTESMGPLRQIVYLGSERSANDSTAGPLVVRLLAFFEHGMQYLTARALEDGGWYLNPSYRAPLPPGGFSFIPVGTDAFLTRTFGTGVDTELRFSESSTGEIRAMFSNPLGELTGRRTAGCGGT